MDPFSNAICIQTKPKRNTKYIAIFQYERTKTDGGRAKENLEEKSPFHGGKLAGGNILSISERVEWKGIFLVFFKQRQRWG